MHKIILLFSLFALSYSQDAEITNVQASQRTDGSKIVDITYDLLPDELFTEFYVTVEISTDGGTNWMQLNQISGDVYDGQLPGTGKSITWNFGGEYPGSYFEALKIRVLAESDYWGNTPFEMVQVTAGEYTSGENDEIQSIDYDFEIMKYEVTNAQYAQMLISALNEGSIWMESGFIKAILAGYGMPDDGEVYILKLQNNKIIWDSENSTFFVSEGYGNHPVVLVSWFGGKFFANYYGCRLLTPQEMEKAARGNTGWDFPWGDDIQQANANYGQSNVPFENTSPVGFFNGQNYDGFQTIDSPSPYGIYDLTGNVAEFTIESYIFGGHFGSGWPGGEPNCGWDAWNCELMSWAWSYEDLNNCDEYCEWIGGNLMTYWESHYWLLGLEGYNGFRVGRTINND